MAITLTDPALIAALQAAGDDVEFRDAAGQIVGCYTLKLPYAPSPESLAKVKLLTEAELAERRSRADLAKPVDLKQFLADFQTA